MKSTFVLGAGASRGIGYPLASDMGVGLIGYMLASDNSMIRGSAEVFSELYGEAPDIEYLLTDISSKIELLGKSGSGNDRVERSRLANARAFLGPALQEWFRTIHIRPSPNYARFANHVVQNGDVVITFNYDDSLERELRLAGKWDVSSGYGFDLSISPGQSETTLLKLHGSMNWLVSLFGGRTGFFVHNGPSLGFKPVIHRVDLEFLGYHSFDGEVFQSGGAFPCLILPDGKKQFFYETSFGSEFEHFWDLLWSQAADALKTSDRLVLIGYSLLPVDQRACDILLHAPLKQTCIEVVSGTQTDRIVQRFRDSGYTNVFGFKSGYFADWLDCAAQ